MRIRVIKPNTVNQWDETATEEYTLLIKDEWGGSGGEICITKVVVKDEDELNELLDESMDIRDTFIVLDITELKKAIKEFEEK